MIYHCVFCSYRQRARSRHAACVGFASPRRSFCGRIRRQFSAAIIIGVILAAVAFLIADQSLVLLIGAGADRHLTEYKGSASRI